MNYYVNCTPRGTDEYENICLDIPTSDMEEVLYYARVLSDEKNISSRKAFGDLVKGVFNQLMEKNYDRKNRKNRRR